ncbi:hypothetical protein [Rhizobium sp. BE258]|jgi:hypothetical protein|nr:hypothetical protein [Rhizobium sp. BE258]MDR7147642.1 hypothetical protein [Rhizobium sp. BE258]
MLWWLLLGYSSFVFTVTAVLLAIVLRQLRALARNNTVSAAR